MIDHDVLIEKDKVKVSYLDEGENEDEMKVTWDSSMYDHVTALLVFGFQSLVVSSSAVIAFTELSR